MGAGGMGGVQDPLLGRCQGVAMATGGVQPMGGRRGMLGDARGEGGTWRAQRSADTGTAPGGGPETQGGPQNPERGKTEPRGSEAR